MIIKTSTWNRESCELYDYENTDDNYCTHYLKKNCHLIRTGNKTDITIKNNPKLKDDYLFNIFCQNNEYFIRKDVNNEFSKEKVWLTLRHYLSSKFEPVN